MLRIQRKNLTKLVILQREDTQPTLTHSNPNGNQPEIFLESNNGMIPGNQSGTSVLKGLLWQQREKRFSRWKERFFMLTQDYLQCFRRGSSKISEMGSFIYRIRLCEV